MYKFTKNSCALWCRNLVESNSRADSVTVSRSTFYFSIISIVNLIVMPISNNKPNASAKVENVNEKVGFAGNIKQNILLHLPFY